MLARGACPTFAHRIHRMLVGKGAAATRQLPSTSSFECADASGGDSIACQRALVGNSLDDEQRSDNLSIIVP